MSLTLANASVRLRDGDRSFRLEVPGLTLAPGEAVALAGPSGSGKTLLLELLGLLRAPADGRYVLRRNGAERDLGALWRGGPRNPDLAAMRGRTFGFVPQTGGLMPFLTVEENVRLPQEIADRSDPGHVRGLIERLGIAEVAQQRPAQLSIGQRQRTAVARALSHRPAFVIADEPTAALDPESADGVLALLLETAKEGGSGLILSSHDLPRVERFGLARRRLEVTSGKEVVSRLEEAPC